MRIGIKIEGLAEAKAAMRERRKSQLPYAIAVGLTRTVKAKQAVIWALLPQEFIIRRPGWARSGIRITPALKTRFEAVIQDINEYMGRQQTGGAKLPKFGRYVAVPLRGAKASPRSLVRAEDSPHSVMERGGFIREKSNGKLIMYRVAFKAGAHRRLSSAIAGITSSSWSRQVVPMYALVSSASVPKRYHFIENVQRDLEGEFARQFERAWEEAERTAR